MESKIHLSVYVVYIEFTTDKSTLIYKSPSQKYQRLLSLSFIRRDGWLMNGQHFYEIVLKTAD